MNTTNENIAKLHESFKKRDEAKVYLSEYFLANQDSLPQELVTAWVGFERLEKEAKTIETEVLTRIEREIDEWQKIEGEKAKFLNPRQLGLVLMLLVILAELGTRRMRADISKYSPPAQLNRCTTGFLAGC